MLVPVISDLSPSWCMRLQVPLVLRQGGLQPLGAVQDGGAAQRRAQPAAAGGAGGAVLQHLWPHRPRHAGIRMRVLKRPLVEEAGGQYKAFAFCIHRRWRAVAHHIAVICQSGGQAGVWPPKVLLVCQSL